MTLFEKLGSYDDSFWDFANFRETSVLSKYPATMVAPMQRELIGEIIHYDSDIDHIMDPFMGSGTVLSIGRELGLGVKGFDINPLATLITRVRIEGVPKDIHQHNENLKARLKLYVGNTQDHTFNNIDKWFRDDVINSLSLIRAAIIDEETLRIRRFYWACFTEIVKKYSNTRTSTFKLHVKEAGKINDMVDDSIEDFKNLVDQYSNNYIIDANNEDISLHTGDSATLLKRCGTRSVDLIYTSPPYGDNHTTVTYGQYSILPLLWIDSRDLEFFDSRMLDNFSAIDSASLGGQLLDRNLRADIGERYSKYILGVSQGKQQKILSFLHDYEAVFVEMARVLRKGKYLVLTLGNRRVDDKEIPFDLFNDDLANKYGLHLQGTLMRTINGKRMPYKVSTVKSKPVKSMSKEYIKIYEKR